MAYYDSLCEDDWEQDSLDCEMSQDSLEMDILRAGNPELEFPLLSEMCVNDSTPWPDDSAIDNLTLNKASTKKEPQEKTKKKVTEVIKDSEVILKFYMKQSKHQRAIQNELKGLLEHEKNILEQLVERSTKFTELKEENKKRQDEWENDHKLRMPFYSQYLIQLMEVPESQGLPQEGIPGEVQQRMLYNIVDTTSNVANNAVVQLSVQNTLMNDVDMSLTKLKQFCSLMLKHNDTWMKALSVHMPNAKRIRDQWGALNTQIENLKTIPAEDAAAMQASITAADFHKEMAKINDRISKIETSTQKLMRDQGPECSDTSIEQDSLEEPRRGGRHAQNGPGTSDDCFEQDSLECEPRRRPQCPRPAFDYSSDCDYSSFQPRACSSPTDAFQDNCSKRSRYQ